MINNSKDDLAKLLVRNLIAALLKREPKDRPSLDSILRRGYIQKVSTWLSDGPPRSVLPNSSNSARRRCSPNRAGALTSVEARGKVKQDGTRGQEPRQSNTILFPTTDDVYYSQSATNGCATHSSPGPKGILARSKLALDIGLSL